MPHAMEWSFATPKMSALRPSSIPIRAVPPLRAIACTGSGSFGRPNAPTRRPHAGTDPDSGSGRLHGRLDHEPVQLDRALPDGDLDRVLARREASEDGGHVSV